MKLPPGYVPGSGLHKPTARGGFGEQLLKKLGWTEGTGLGVDGQGIPSAIKVQKKDDTLGVGSRQSVREADKDWWETAYNAAANGVKEASSGSSSSESDGEPDGSAALCNRDGTLASASQTELQLMRQLAKDPWGRFGGRNGKMERIRRQEAAMAAAGQALQSSHPEVGTLRDTASPSGDSNGAVSVERSASTSVRPTITAPKHALVADQPGRPLKRMRTDSISSERGSKQRRRSPSAALNSECTNNAARVGRAEKSRREAASSSVVAAPSRSLSWWGAATFVPSGRLEGLAEPSGDGARTQQSFTEATQADLYERTQAGKAAGKQGLGVGKGLSADHAWTGSRTVFADDAAPDNGPVIASRPKLKALCRRLLTEAGDGPMRLAKLTRLVRAALPADELPTNLRQKLREKLQKSRNFVLDRRTIRTASS